MSKENWDEGGEEVASNWFKFDKVGDFIKGTKLSQRLKPGDGNFGDQMVYEIRDAEGTVWNVGVAMTKEGTVSRLNGCKFGELVGVKFDSEGEPPQKGFNKVKNLLVKSWGMDPNYIDGEDPSDQNPDF